MRGEQTVELTRGKLHGDCFVNMQYALDHSRAAEHERSSLCFGKWHHIFSAIVFIIFLDYASGIFYGEFKPRVAVETLY